MFGIVMIYAFSMLTTTITLHISPSPSSILTMMHIRSISVSISLAAGWLGGLNSDHPKQCSSGPYNECVGNPVSKKLSGGLDKFDFHLIFESMTFGKQLTGVFSFRVRASNRALCCNGA